MQPKPRDVQVETFFDERTGLPYKAERTPDGEWRRVGGVQSKTVSGGNGKENVDVDTYLSWDQERRDAYDRLHGRAERKDFNAEIKKKIADERQSALNRFDKMSSYERKPLLESAGIDPNSPNARANYANKVRDDYKTQLGVDLFDGTVRSGSGTSAKDGGSKPNKTAEKSPYPDGTKLKGPDGKMYIVRDGKPVPYGS